MKSLAGLFWVAHRVAAGHRGRLGGQLLVLLVATLASTCLLLTATAPYIAADRRARADLQQVDMATPVPPGKGLLVGGSVERTKAGVLERVVIGRRTAMDPRPPGVKRLPSDGEMVVSPRLASLLRDNQDVAQGLPFKVVDVIENDGLTDPHQLLAYIGESAGAFPTDTGVAGFGAKHESDSRNRYLLWLVTGSVALLIVLPLLMLLGATLRLSRDRMRHQLNCLTLVGLSRRRCAFVSAIDCLLVSALGALLGLLIAELLLSRVTRLGALDVSWFPSAASSRPAWLDALLLAAIPTLAVVLTIAMPLRVERSPRASRITQEPVRFAPLLLIVAGLLVLLYVGFGPSVQRDSSTWSATLFAGSVLFALGLASGLASIVRLLAWTVSRATMPASWWLASLRLSVRPSSVSRSAGVFGALVFTLAAVGPMVTQVLPASATAERLMAENGRTLVRLEPVPRDFNLRVITTSPSVLFVLRGYLREPADETETFVVTCAQLRVLSGMSRCPGGPVELVPAESAPAGETAPAAGGVGQAALPSPLQIPALRSGVEATGGATLTVSEPDAGSPASRWSPSQVLLVAMKASPSPVSAVAELRQRVQASSPLTQAVSPGESALVGDGTLVALQRWLVAGCVFLTAVSGLAIVIGAVGAWRQRRPHSAGVLALGASPTAVRSAYVAELIMTFAVALGAAGAGGFVVGAASARVTGAELLTPADLSALFGGASLLALLIVIASAGSARLRFDPADLRRE